jgi:cysteine synthase A
LDTIGRTPAVRLAFIAPGRVALYAKIEAFNPMGSVKDRLALGVIEDAERSGTLSPGQTVVEATSGYTGIGLAMVCARKGYPLIVTMAENFSVERRKLLRFLGSKVVLTPAAEKGSGMLRKAQELAEKHGWFLCRQFENEANANVHSRTTAEEILEDFADSGFGLLGHRLRHRGHAQRRSESAQRAQSCHAHRGVRARQLADSRQRNRSAVRR